MLKKSVIACAVSAGLALFATTVGADRIGPEPDRLCQMLFDEYVVGTGKIDSSLELAASQIVAARGRGRGFWRDVLRELQKDDEKSELGCVRVLGKMLELDADARDLIRRQEETGEVFQQEASIFVGSEVVAALIARGEKADRFRVDHYAIALARARLPDACGLFRAILQDDTGKHYMESAKFHAAVGLAQSGEGAGFEWLIQNSANSTSTVSNAWPRRAPSLNLDACCIAALQQLSGKDDLRTPQDCEAWWKRLDKPTAARNHVEMVEQ